MRLDRFLSGQTSLSRSEAVSLIRRGCVTVNGAVVRRPEIAVDPANDAVTASGKAVVYAEFRYFLLHKPEGVLTAARDPAKKTVLDLISPEDRRKGLFPSGRLDLDTAGLLLITDDGALSHKMLSPRSHAAKYYLAALRDDYDSAYAAVFRKGILLREGDTEEPCLPAQCDAIGRRLAVLELYEGKYHQVRRMFAAVGNHVEHLLRVQIGSLPLPPELPRGGYLQIFNKDVSLLLADSSISRVCAFCEENYSSYWINETR